MHGILIIRVCKLPYTPINHFLTRLFTSIFRDGFLPADFCGATVQPTHIAPSILLCPLTIMGFLSFFLLLKY